MIEKLVNELMEIKTSQEILAYKSQTIDLYNQLYKKMESQDYYYVNYDDIKALHDLKQPMIAYYGPYFYKKCGIPFVKEHNPNTIDVIEVAILFYIIQVMELLEIGFYHNIDLCIYETSLEIFDRVENIDLTKSKYKEHLFVSLWSYFVQVICIKDNGREISLSHENNVESFYLADKKYEEILEMIYDNFKSSHYSHIIDKILGIYKVRFTKMDYILNYQPLFVEVSDEYLWSLIELKKI